MRTVAVQGRGLALAMLSLLEVPPGRVIETSAYASCSTAATLNLGVEGRSE